MGKKFEHYHLSLVERAQADLLTPPMSREEWLRAAFASSFQFRHQAKLFYWVPHPNLEGVILGTVQRQKQRVQHRPPVGEEIRDNLDVHTEHLAMPINDGKSFLWLISLDLIPLRYCLFFL
ncbi:hypothetical protein [Brevundimonas sp.]|uniref:hypothetical protein n=1 Tax=Brevundimonas sp. TaxID=1871086 RepID=UPI002899014D|nr:hypothetical protein [Brevundimonas sp.]